MSRLGHLLRLPCRSMTRRPACLFHWRPRAGINFGDALSIDLVSQLLAHEHGGRNVPTCAKWSCRRRLLAVGSILHDSRRGDVVWGSGINGKMSSRDQDFSGVDFRAVRGPLTREMVLRSGAECPDILGDPALLLPRLFPEFRRAPTSGHGEKLTFIPNINDAAFLDPRDIQAQGAEWVVPTRPWREIAATICASTFVVGSSLHALVLSDAFGVPCRPCASLFEAPFKYEDHLLATDRGDCRIARNLREALQLGPLPTPVIDLQPLLEAFPWDLFRAGIDGAET